MSIDFCKESHILIYDLYNYQRKTKGISQYSAYIILRAVKQMPVSFFNILQSCFKAVDGAALRGEFVFIFGDYIALKIAVVQIK